MSILFQGLKVISANEVQKPQDYVFHKGKLELASSDDLPSNLETIDCSQMLASKGWVDLRCGVGEPGLEYKETIDSLCQTLIGSGFTAAVILPNTEPVIQSKNDVDFLINRSKKYSVDLFAQGAVTKNTDGENLTEILDMHHQSGVKIFGDGTKPLSNGDRYMKILQYLQKFDGVLFDHAYDPLLSIFGQMHEGDNSTMLGMKGIPSLAEEVAIQRNIEILKYTGGKVHFQTISSAKAVSLIRQAKEEGLNVTCDVSIYQLLFTDNDLMDFDPNYKVKPPFRSELDKQALLEGVKDHTIDAIVSNHQPQDYDSKFMEFDLAAFGMIGLQTFLPAMVKLEKELGWPLLMEKVGGKPSEIIELQNDSWTIFNPNEEWLFNRKTNTSNSQNSPWFDQKLTGRVNYVIQKGELIKLDE
ncbi:dihydroorotase [Algoriphagus machipongonensis]|uniref:Dihydroorotase (DHOase) n=1 Tax=Algoriphagus machipongonensis TaxID=388413 RepID=A3HYA6_9BACT|nr:dihydroorotase [Algoriphagus machipongonensis]EAZ80242.1 dihydroorotase (DHOase) [Algoriphagus machipongonensis]